MRQFLTKIIFAVLLIGSPMVSADQQTVTLSQLIVAALQNNPDIQAAESRYRSAQAKPSQMRTLPDPVLSFVSRNGNGNPTPFTELGKDPLSSIGLMWEQEIPFPGKLRLAGEMSQKEADAARADVDTVRSAVISNLKSAYYEYFRADRSLSVLGESLGLLKELEEIARTRYTVGQGIQQDVLRSQLEISILNQRLISLEQERATAAAEINRLLNRVIDEPLPSPAEILTKQEIVPLESLQKQMAETAPEIRSREAMVDREERGLALAKKQYHPDFMTSVEYANTPKFADMWEIRLGLRIPIFYRSKQTFGVTEASENLTRARRDLQSVKEQIAFSVKTQFLQIQASAKLLKLYEQGVIPQSKLALESSIASYQVGKSDFLTTLTNFTTVLEYRISYYEELAKHETAIARLEQTVGRPVVMISTGGENNE